MKFMNEMDIEAALSRHSDPSKVKHWAAVILSGHVHAVNTNSDGWAHWAAPVNAAKQLIEVLEATDWSESKLAMGLRLSVIPLKRFYTKHAPQMTHDSIARELRAAGYHVRDISK